MNITDFGPLLNAGVSGGSAPYTVTGRELQELVSPITPDDFAGAYFSRVSLYAEGHAQKFEHIFSWAKLSQALARGRTIKDPRFNIMASYAGGEATGSREQMFEARIDQVSELLNAGATICITNIHMADPALARWAQAIHGQLNFTGTVGINCYVSPDGAGLPMHYDKRVATTLQIAGSKRWIFSTEAAKPWPDDNGLFQDGRVDPGGPDAAKHPDTMEFREVELKPGDLLCLPAGAWHAARGVGHSLALNLYFAPRNLYYQFAPLLLKFAAASGAWRGGPPASVADTHGKMPEDVAAYFRERLSEFHKMAAETLRDPRALEEQWLNALTDAPYTGWQAEPDAPLPTATPNDKFRVAKAGLRFIETANKVVVSCDKGLLYFPPAFAPYLRRFAQEPEGAPLPTILSWGQIPPRDLVPHLQTLFKQGILELG